MTPADRPTALAADDAPTEPSSLRAYLLYFLRLGALGFGGPIALAGYMQRDLVEQRRWVTRADYLEGLALAQLAPGPLAAQLAIYLGWVRAGVLGATLVGAAFVLPSFVMVLALAAVYVRAGALPGMQAAFYGVNAAVIAIIARSAAKLVRTAVGRDPLRWALLAASAAVTIVTESEALWVFVLAGLVAMLVRAPPARLGGTARGLLPVWLVTGLHGPADGGTLWTLAWYFAEAGSVVFGSGLAIVPFLRGGVVERFHWLTDAQFLDAVAVAMLTPGPVVITVAFIGYLVAGLSGATVAALGVFLPCYLLVVLPAPYFRRFAKDPHIKAFVDGVTAAATGAIVGAVVVLGRRAIRDVPTAVIAAATLVLLVKARKLPEPVLIVAAGIAGLVLARGGRP
jgi:chromate transporter